MPIKGEREDSIQEKYKRALDAVENSGVVSIKLLEAESIKYRLTLRKTQKGVIHSLEIMEKDSAIPAVRIDLIGNWEEVLRSADHVLSEMSMDDYRKVAEMLKTLRPQRRTRGVEEL